MDTVRASVERIALATLKQLSHDRGQRLAMKCAGAVLVGDIFVASWGYNQTNIDFFQVVKTTPTTVAIRPINKKIVRGKGQPTEYVMPLANSFKGPVKRKKLKDWQGRPYVNLNSYSSAYKWEGKPAQQTGGAYGH